MTSIHGLWCKVRFINISLSDITSKVYNLYETLNIVFLSPAGELGVFGRYWARFFFIPTHSSNMTFEDHLRTVESIAGKEGRVITPTSPKTDQSSVCQLFRLAGEVTVWGGQIPVAYKVNNTIRFFNTM